jgi:hypothetical protein
VRSNSLADHSPAQRTHSLVADFVVRLRDDAGIAYTIDLTPLGVLMNAQISEMNQTAQMRALFVER